LVFSGQVGSGEKIAAYAVGQQEAGGMASSGKLSDVARMKNSGVIKDHARSTN
jgi:hypothetical protein